MLLNRLRPFVVVQDNRSLEASLRRFKTYETTWKVKSDSAAIEETEHMLQKRFGKKEAKRYAEELRAKSNFAYRRAKLPRIKPNTCSPCTWGRGPTPLRLRQLWNPASSSCRATRRLHSYGELSKCLGQAPAEAQGAVRICCRTRVRPIPGSHMP